MNKLRDLDNIKGVLHLEKKFIEFDLPIEEISPLAIREANGRIPIYRIHKWWARRLGSVFRGLILASLYSGQNPKLLWEKYQENTTFDWKPVILDTFVGGGVSMMEGLRLGCKVIGIDINPVAWFITKMEVEPFDLVKLEKEYLRLRDSVGEKISSYYETECSNGHRSEIIYVLWNTTIDCKACGRVTDMFRDYVILEKDDNAHHKIFTVLCPNCGEVFINDSNKCVRCPNCKNEFNPGNGNTSKGYFTCPCGTKQSVVEAIKVRGRPLQSKMFCIEYDCETCGRGIKKPGNLDVLNFLRAVNDFSAMKDKLPFPKEAIPSKGKQDQRPTSHGYAYFSELFNSRQLLNLSMLLDEIIKISDRQSREFLLLAFSASLETNNLLCKFETKWDKISASFAIPAYHPTERMAENNVWGGRFGRGTFSKTFNKLIMAKKLGMQVTEKHQRHFVTSNIPYKFSELANTFDDLAKTDKNALITCRNSDNLSFIPDQSIDLVITDPPYFDIMTYSRLSDFFYVWLRLGLFNDYPDLFKSHTSTRDKEIVMAPLERMSKDEFVSALSKIFSEVRRVLKKQVLLVFTFHHTQEWAWAGLANALNNAGMFVKNIHYIRSEGKTGLRKNGKVSYDACIVCTIYDPGTKMHRYNAVTNSSKMWIRRLSASGNGLQEADIRGIVMGQILLYKSNMLDSQHHEKYIERTVEVCIKELERTKQKNQT